MDYSKLKKEEAASNASLVAGFGPSGEGASAAWSAPIVPRVAEKNASDSVPVKETNAQYYAKLGKS